MEDIGEPTSKTARQDLQEAEKREHLSSNLAQALEDSKASVTLRDALQRSLDLKKERALDAAKKRAKFDVAIDRYEAKFIIPSSLVPGIREYIKPFVDLDPYCSGDPPQYTITTLQLDSPRLSLHYAKLWDFVNRFKLRVRTYGDPVGQFPVFLEVKAKYRNSLVKSRSHLPFEKWGKYLFEDEVLRGIQFKSRQETDNFYQFLRLTKEIGARPTMLIRYNRESYFGTMERYSRITFDRRLQYQQTFSWDSWGRDGQWRSLDTPIMQTRRHDKEVNYSGVILEIKTLSDIPKWMVSLIIDFGLVRSGHCKYSNAIWAESMFRGTPMTPEYEADLLMYL